MPRILKLLSHADPQVAISANSPNVLTPIIQATVPRGLGWVFPGTFPWILKLRKADGTDISPESRLYFAIRVPSEPDRLWPVGARILYYPWAELGLAQQHDADYRDSIMARLEMDILPLTEDETLIISLLSPDTIAPTRCIFYIPYWETTSTEVTEELTYRAGLLRV